MRRAVAGVIGHVDHGKTALVRALTGTDTDRLPEEKRRGFSIALGFAHLTGGDCSVDLIDMPGHERFIRTMISGATGIDVVLLVVAADAGIQPQTIEHVAIAGLIGIRRAIVAVAKADLIDPLAADILSREAVELLAANGLTALHVAITSATTGEGVEPLREALLRAMTGDNRPTDGQPFLPIDRAFTVAGHGAVVTGTLRGGAIAPGDVLDLHPEGRAVRVRGVQVHGQPAIVAQPGQRVAINLRGVDRALLGVGMALAAPDSVAPSEWLTVALRRTVDAPPLTNGARLQALIGTTEASARLRLLDRDELLPGGEALAQVRLARPLASPVGEALVLRFASPARTVAGGPVLDTAPRRLRRYDPAVLARLQLLRDNPPEPRVAALIAQAAGQGMPFSDIARLTALAPWRLTQLLQALPATVGRSGIVVDDVALSAVAAEALAHVCQHPAGASLTTLASAITNISPAVLDLALTRLVEAGQLVRQGSRFRSPAPRADAVRRHAADDLQTRLAERLRAAGLQPPLPRDLAVDPASTQALDRLVRAGVLVRAVDRAKGKELLFHSDAVAEARERLRPLLAQPAGLLVTEIAVALGLSRKFVMPLLDHLDTIHFTRRVGDHRLLWRLSD